MNYPQFVKETLYEKIQEMSEYSWLFAKNSGTDFTRKRKIDFSQLLTLLVSMEAGRVKKELLEFFQYDIGTPTTSAFIQQRSKLLPETMPFLFKEFSESFDAGLLFQGYRLFACNGSDIGISRNPNDELTYYKNYDAKGYNLLHLDAIYDLCNHCYLDADVQHRKGSDETSACITMLKRTKVEGNKILIADRGYENHNLLEHANQLGWKYLIRIKDRSSNEITSGLYLPEEDRFDVDITLNMTRRSTNEIKSSPSIYKYILFITEWYDSHYLKIAMKC